MTHHDRAGLSVAAELASFIEDEVLPGLGIGADGFWNGVADVFARFTPENRKLLARRDDLQARIDAWYRDRKGQPHDPAATESFLRDIGYLVDEPAPFSITTEKVDDELARLAGPQLVVPILNARFLLNAANARWGSLYDALYGTDALGDLPPTGPYDAARGARVVVAGQGLPRRGGSAGNRVVFAGRRLVDRGRQADAGSEGSDAVRRLSRRAVGADVDPAGQQRPAHRTGHRPVERHRRGGRGAVCPTWCWRAPCRPSAIWRTRSRRWTPRTRSAAYRNWLGLMKGDLSASFQKGGQTLNRTLEPDRTFTAPGGGAVTLPGRSACCSSATSAT